MVTSHNVECNFNSSFTAQKFVGFENIEYDIWIQPHIELNCGLQLQFWLQYEVWGFRIGITTQLQPHQPHFSVVSRFAAPHLWPQPQFRPKSPYYIHKGLSIWHHIPALVLALQLIDNLQWAWRFWFPITSTSLLPPELLIDKYQIVRKFQLGLVLSICIQWSFLHELHLLRPEPLCKTNRTDIYSVKRKKGRK